MIRRFFLTVAFVWVAAVASAQAISMAEAQAIARKLFLPEGSQRYIPTQVDLHLAHTRVLQGDTCFYVFNRGINQGFAIVGANEMVLGYSDHGAFDLEQAPHALLELLEAHSRKIAAGITAKRAARVSRRNVSPICQTLWSQEAPYNNFLPIPKNDPSLTLATGCVATATAQVLKCFEYPAHGLGNHTYTCTQVELPDGYTTMTFSANFAAHTYDWDSMLDYYYDDDNNLLGSKKNWDAIALLMYDLGVASDMNYGALEASGSGTMTDQMAEGLRKYFDYDCTYEYIEDNITEDEWDAWEQKVYQELAAGYPIIYAGAGEAEDAGGHCFVIDGYQASTGKFHVNWGWAGVCDGYYVLYDGLAPDEQGTGGVADDYSYGQEMIYLLRPKGNVVDAVESISTTSSMPTKLLQDGQLMIRRNGQTFDALGRKIN